MFGAAVEHEIEFITETTLVPYHVVAKIQEADFRAQKVWLRECNVLGSEMVVQFPK